MTTKADVEFWECVPFPERTRLVHTLVRGIKEIHRVSYYEDFYASPSSYDLAADIADVTSDITMSLWDYNGKEWK